MLSKYQTNSANIDSLKHQYALMEQSVMVVLTGTVSQL